MLSSILTAVAMATTASAHIVMSYPGWRGNNLITNETYPYGMQWEYPCEYRFTASRLVYHTCWTKLI